MKSLFVFNLDRPGDTLRQMGSQSAVDKAKMDSEVGFDRLY